MTTADQLVAHAVGDYVLQSDWCANEKTKRSLAAFVHVVLYAVPFLLITMSPWAISAIMATHFAIDRWRLARFVCWAKNWIGPPGSNGPWRDRSSTGYDPHRPPWLAVWLMIITDNIMHVAINAAAIRWL